MSSTPPTHALWRPGVGLSLWFTDPSGAVTSEPGDDLPAPVAGLVDGRSLRRTVAIRIGEATVHAGTLTLGPAAAVALLDDPDLGDSPGGELVFYRHVTQAVRRFVTSGAVAPSVAWVGGSWSVRWIPVPTTRWRTWLSQACAAAPQVVVDNGGAEAVDDFCREIVDLTCRERCRDIPAGAVRSPFVRSLLLDAESAIASDRASAASRMWQDWSDTVREGESSLVLRLHEPTAPADPDLVEMDAEYWRLQVCRRTADGDEPLEIRRLSPLELDEITTELAGAVRVFEPLARAGHDDHTLDFLLDTETVGALLDHGATALGDSGIGVLLPRTIAVATPTLSLRGVAPGATVQRSVMAGLAEIRDFQWQLALGDTVLDEGELRSLAEQKGSLVRVRGVWVRADGASLRRAAEFITTQQALAASGHPPDMGELFGLVTGSGGPGIPVSSVSGLSWLDDIADQGAVRPDPRPVPDTLVADLRPYQHRGVEWLAHLSDLGIGAVLADDMGLGKTIQVIALLCGEREDRADDGPGPTLIVCPMSVVGNWEREIARFAPHLRVLVHHGPGRTRAARFAAAVATADVVVTTYAITVRDKESLATVDWERVVVDEAQHVKNVSTAAARAVRAVRARHRVALTGTPVENRLEDLRAVVDLVNPGLLGSPSAFKARFAEAIERERDPEAVRRLAAITQPFILRRVKTDPAVVADLPAKTELTVRANLTVEQAALYRAVTDDLMAALGKVESDATHEGHRVRTVLAALTRLKQVCNHPAHFLGDGSPLLRRNAHRSGKLELLADIVDTIVADGERALLFTQFTAFGEMLAPWLAARLDTPIPFLHGGVGRTARDGMVEQFSADDGPPLMIASLKAGGTGLNLTAANHVLHVDRWWNPAVEDQATDRAHRIGQQREVEVRTFVCIGTIEERIDAMIRDKRTLSDLTVTSGEHWLADIGDDELHDLIRLRDEAVGE
ncbi:DEAD/DEAH box helicase [uncultured Williamsia sp.]|uniref:DEAD/DEAH box helicase n=1 Tax=uncultured Williamsia sp. TaxID=259311 RepID=UPI00262E7870|nr:DEAD/DEAH box helicase [uncultured Williamsia sp.]